MSDRKGLSLDYHRSAGRSKEQRDRNKVSNLLVWAKPTGVVGLVKVGPRLPKLADKLVSLQDKFNK